MKLDYLNGTDYSIHQKENMYHFNSDTELLGRFMDVHHKDSVLDIGCNNGALLFYAYHKGCRNLCGIDLFEEVIDCAKENFERNRIECDLYVTPLQSFSHAPFDLIACNPPYFNTKNESLKNENLYLKAARHEEYMTLRDLLTNVPRLLKDKGRFDMVFRTDRLGEVLSEANRNGLYAARMKIAYKDAHSQGKSVLLEFVKKPDILLRVEKPAFLNERSTFE